VLRIGGQSFSPEKSTSHDRGRVVFYLGSRGAIATVAEGHIVLNDARALTDLCHQVRLKFPSLFIFHDWERVNSYDSDARLHLTQWTLSQPRSTMAECHVLLRANLVAMGVSTAALALRLVGVPVYSYTNRLEFELRRARTWRESSL
jgi:hypothetical protein